MQNEQIAHNKTVKSLNLMNAYGELVSQTVHSRGESQLLNTPSASESLAKFHGHN
jgi:hypothetical protein